MWAQLNLFAVRLAMYGMIHKAAKDYARQHIDDAVWQSILTRCKLNDEHFISGQQYDDSATIGLLVEIANALEMQVDALLFEFGKFWIGFTANSSYGTVMDMAGDDLATFISNLDDMHLSIEATMPGADMPSFSVLRQSPTEIELIYRSSRTGLTEFVRGLLAGLMDRFNETGDIQATERGEDIVFRITRRSAVKAA